MNSCPNVLEIYANIANIGKVDEDCKKHIDDCEICSDISFEITSLLLAEATGNMLIDSEKIAMDVLLTNANNVTDTDKLNIKNIFLSNQGREYAANFTEYELTDIKLSRSLEEKIKNTHKQQLLKTSKKTILSYGLELKNKAGQKIKDIVSDALISVTNLPVLTPAMEQVRAPVYNDVAIIKNKKEVELPFYFDSDNFIRIKLSFCEGMNSLDFSLISEGSEEEIDNIDINGVNYTTKHIEIPFESFIDIQIFDKEGTEYCCSIEFK